MSLPTHREAYGQHLTVPTSGNRCHTRCGLERREAANRLHSVPCQPAEQVAHEAMLRQLSTDIRRLSTPGTWRHYRCSVERQEAADTLPGESYRRTRWGAKRPLPCELPSRWPAQHARDQPRDSVER